jgi:hypothetical protein
VKIQTRVVSLALVLFFITSGFATDGATKKCTQVEAMQAEKEADSLNNWDQIYRSYRRFSQCDDGAIAEGYSDSVMKLLADDWKSFNRLVVLANRGRDFRGFVLKHIDETVPADRLAKIARNARSECAAGGRNLCLSIAKATRK